MTAGAIIALVAVAVIALDHSGSQAQSAKRAAASADDQSASVREQALAARGAAA